MKGELGWRGSNSISVSGHHKGGRCIFYMKSQVEGPEGGLANLLMSMRRNGCRVRRQMRVFSD
jgi:hypothetical protein